MKQIFNIVALLAILNLLGLIGLGVYVVASGRLDSEKVEKIAAVMRGEELVPAEEKRPPTTQPVVTPVLARGSGEKIANARMREEAQRLKGERLLRETADRKALVDAAMLKVTQQLETLEKKESEFREARRLASQADRQSGTQAELVIISGLSEKRARDLLMKKEMPDAVNLLLKMKPRTATGIIEACKTETEKAWAVQVLQEISSQDEDRAKRLAKAIP